jgi:hypothetical protein
MYGEGTVTAKRVDDDGRHLVDIELVIGNQDGPQCPVSITAAVPSNAT